MDSEGKAEKKRLGCLGRIFVGTALLVAAYYAWRAYQHYDIDRKYEYAMRQCEKYGGQKGQIPVVTEGVYDHRRRTRKENILLRASEYFSNGLRYVEFSKEVIRLSFNEGFERSGPYYKKGRELFSYYRVYIAQRGDILCKPYEYVLQQGHITFDSASLNSDQCIAVEGFDDPALLKAPYELVVVDNAIDENVLIQWTEIQVRERNSQQTLASFNVFSQCFTT
ncbi:MAG: hypothetical protein KDI01_04880, partial [Halioglobus sp.]|nr:hypothetical protein [Halioglobus sp.]